MGLALPELEALRSAALEWDTPAVLAAGLALTLGLAALATLVGPTRLRVGSTGAARGRWRRPDLAWALSTALRTAALALLLAALAGPVAKVPENTAGGSGIDLLIAIDASGSMGALDGRLEGRRVTRLELARAVVADFVRQRRGDRIGLVVFGEHALTQCPLTVDHRLVLRALERVEIGLAGDATALGEAIGLATTRLDVAGAPPEGRRVLVLLTDGRHNAGQLAPETASRIARLHGVHIHAVGIGGTGRVPFARRAPGEPIHFEQVDLDRETLRRVAELTGGSFFHARRPEDLDAVAAAIDRLERSPRRDEVTTRRASLAAPALGLALLLLALDALLGGGPLRRLP